MTKEERRLFGAMAVIHDNGNVLAYVDDAKPEISSLVAPKNTTEWDWWDSSTRVLGFPAGGRQENSKGLQETLRQNLERELLEETVEDSPELARLATQIIIPRRNREGTSFVQQRYPFAVAQRAKQSINQIGVTSARIEFQKFNRDSQQMLQMRIDQGLAYWINLQDIYEALMDGDPKSSEFHGKKARPQFFAAGLIWYMEQKAIDPQIIRESIQKGNQELIQQASSLSAQLELPKRNGSLQDSGEVERLTKRDRQFILGN